MPYLTFKISPPEGEYQGQLPDGSWGPLSQLEVEVTDCTLEYWEKLLGKSLPVQKICDLLWKRCPQAGVKIESLIHPTWHGYVLRTPGMGYIPFDTERKTQYKKFLRGLRNKVGSDD